jgi:uncharacterized integral membrane protein
MTAIDEQPKNHIPKIIIGTIIVLLLVVFSVQNSFPATVKLYFWEINAPLVLWFVICFILGITIAIVALWPISRHSKRKTKLIEELKARIELLEYKEPKDNNTSNPI